MTVPQPLPHSSSLIAGSVLPIRRAEELLATLPGVIAARIIASDNGAVDEIHVLTTSEVTPKQTVRNIESALIAHLGMRVDHRKISVATTLESQPSKDAVREAAKEREAKAAAEAAAAAPVAPPLPVKVERANGRLLYFEDVEVRRSRAKGIACRVTLKKGEESFVGEAEGMENERSRVGIGRGATDRGVRSRVRVRRCDGAAGANECLVDGKLRDPGERRDGQCVGRAGRDESLDRAYQVVDTAVPWRQWCGVNSNVLHRSREATLR